MAGIEETLTRIGKMGGVEGFVITDAEGHVLRQSKSFDEAQAAQYASEVLKLTKRARHVVRDLEPKVHILGADVAALACIPLRRAHLCEPQRLSLLTYVPQLFFSFPAD